MNDQNRVSRRRAVGTILGGASVAGLAAGLTSRETRAAPAPQTKMPTRSLGRTGHQACLFSLGGQATLEQPHRNDEAVAIINRAIDQGVNYIDTAAAYGNGTSETYIGQVMRMRRKEVFLASKTHDRSYDGSMRLLERSLKNLQTDRLDLWQLHNVCYREELEHIFAADGALKALEKARDQRMVRFLGITGHFDPLVLKQGIERYPFDSILMALNAADTHNHSFIQNLLPSAVERKMAIIGMKVVARGNIFRPDGISRMEQAMHYVLSLPVSTIIVGISKLPELDENVRIAANFKPCGQEEMAQLAELTRPYYAAATYFRRKT